MSTKALFVVLCLQRALGFDCAQNERLVEKNSCRVLGILFSNVKDDWSVKGVDYAYPDTMNPNGHRTVALVNEIQPGWRLTKLQIEGKERNLEGDVLVQDGIKSELLNPQISSKMCFETKKEKGRFNTKLKNPELWQLTQESCGMFETRKAYAEIEYDWSNWTVKRFQTTNLLGDFLLNYGAFPRVQPGWKISAVHFWNDHSDDYYPNPRTLNENTKNSIKERLLDPALLEKSITFEKPEQPLNSDDNPKDERNSFGENAYVMRRLKDGTSQACRCQVFELKKWAGTYEKIAKLETGELEREVRKDRIFPESPICNFCLKIGHCATFCPQLWCRICGEKGHSYKTCAKENECWICRSKGHFTKECKNQRRCKNCWKYGHEERNCRDKMLCFRCCKIGHSHISMKCPKHPEKRPNSQQNSATKTNIKYYLTEYRENKSTSSSQQPSATKKNSDSQEKKFHFNIGDVLDGTLKNEQDKIPEKRKAIYRKLTYGYSNILNDFPETNALNRLSNGKNESDEPNFTDNVQKNSPQENENAPESNALNCLFSNDGKYEPSFNENVMNKSPQENENVPKLKRKREKFYDILGSEQKDQNSENKDDPEEDENLESTDEEFFDIYSLGPDVNLKRSVSNQSDGEKSVDVECWDDKLLDKVKQEVLLEQQHKKVEKQEDGNEDSVSKSKD